MHTCEVWNLAGTCLLVETFDITGLARLKRCADVTLIEFEACILMNLFGKVSVGTIR